MQRAESMGHLSLSLSFPRVSLAPAGDAGRGEDEGRRRAAVAGAGGVRAGRSVPLLQPLGGDGGREDRVPGPCWGWVWGWGGRLASRHVGRGFRLQIVCCMSGTH